MWFNVHMWLKLFLVVFTTEYFALAVLTFKETGCKEFAVSKLHHMIGLVVFVFANVQVIDILMRHHINHEKNHVSA